jgi:elongation factor G
MDRIGADFYRTVSMIEKQLQAKALPIQLPLGSENLFRGIIDLVENKAIIFADEPGIAPVEEPIPEDERVTATKYHQMLIEKLAEEDDQIMALYLEGQDISVPQLKLAIRRATISSRLVPILCGSALRNKGIQPLIDAIVDYLPSPIDMPPTPATALGRDEQILCYPKDEEPFAALAFKVVSDPFMGRLTYLRVYSGKVKTGAQVLNCNRNKKERIGKLYLMHANRREQREEADSGSIIAALGLKNTSTGDTLCDPARPLHFEAIRFPEPVLSMAITAKSKADKDRLDDVLAKFTIEDSTFNVRHDQETGQIIISGMGELQLEVLLDRMCREFGVKASVGKPEVAYKETIAGIIESEGRFVRQTGGRGQYGHVWLKLEPGERGGGFCFCNQIRGGAIPEEFIPPVEGGVKEALESGVLAGDPVVDIKVTLYDGSFHEVDSSDLAFKMAGFIAVKNGLKRARLILLEPIMSMEIITPTRFLGDITGELNSRRSHIGNIEVREEFDSIRCSIPLAETFGFASTLRSLSQGRATYSMQFHRYEELPRGLAERLVAGMRTR